MTRKKKQNATTPTTTATSDEEQHTTSNNFSYHDSSVIAATPCVSNGIAALYKVHLRKLRAFEWAQTSNIVAMKVN